MIIGTVISNKFQFRIKIRYQNIQSGFNGLVIPFKSIFLETQTSYN